MLRTFLIAAAVPLLCSGQITLNGAIDIHAHADPDGTRSPIDHSGSQTPGRRERVVTHAMTTQVGMSVNECKHAAALGAFIEFVWVEMANAIGKSVRSVYALRHASAFELRNLK